MVTYHRMEKLTKEMCAFLGPRSRLPLLLVPEYSGINKEQRIHDRSKIAHRSSVQFSRRVVSDSLQPH